MLAQIFSLVIWKEKSMKNFSMTRFQPLVSSQQPLKSCGIPTQGILKALALFPMIVLRRQTLPSNACITSTYVIDKLSCSLHIKRMPRVKGMGHKQNVCLLQTTQ